MPFPRSPFVLILAACVPGGSTDDDRPPGPSRPGDAWIAYVASATGEDEVWLVRDDGGRNVRVTNESLAGELGGGRLLNPRLAWDGSQIAVHAGVGADGVTRGSSIWVLQSDGSSLHHLLEVDELLNVSWSGDSRDIYGPEPAAQCPTSLMRIDSSGVADFERFYTANIGGASSPLVRPTNPNDVLFSDLPCATGTGALLLDVQRGVTTSLPVLDGVFISAWSADGSLVVGTRDGAVVVVDFDAGQVTNEFTDPDASFQFPQFAGSNKRVVALERAPTIPHIAMIDLERQSVTRVGLPHDISGTAVTWATLASDPDRDGDGLGNAIDPAPDDPG